MQQLATSLARSTYGELEQRTCALLEEALTALQADKVRQLEELARARLQIGALLDQAADLSKLVALRESQVAQEFALAVKQLRAQATDHLRLQKGKIRAELRGQE